MALCTVSRVHCIWGSLWTKGSCRVLQRDCCCPQLHLLVTSRLLRLEWVVLVLQQAPPAVLCYNDVSL